MGSDHLNSSRILWQNNTLNELKSLLGDGIEIDVEESLFASELDFPWPITISSVDIKTDSQGETWVSMIISFDAIEGASRYEVRFSPYTTVPFLYFTSDDSGGDYQGIFNLPAATGNDEVGFIVCLADVITPVGGYAEWTAIHNAGVIDSDEIALWQGVGVSDDTSIVAERDDPFPVTATGYGFFAFRNVSGSVYLKALQTTSHSSGTAPHTTTTATVTAEQGDIVVAGVRYPSAHPGPPSEYIANGFGGTGIQDGITGVYANGVSSIAGVADGGPVSVTFTTDEGGSTTATDFIAVFGVGDSEYTSTPSSPPPTTTEPIPVVTPGNRFSTRLAVGVNEDLWEKSTTSSADTITTVIRSDGTRVFRATAGDHAPNSNNSTFARYRIRLPEKYGIAPNRRFWISAKVNLLTSATHYYSFLRSDNYVATIKGTSTQVGCAGGNEWRTGIAMQPGNEIQLITTHQNNSTTVLWSGTLLPGLHDVAFMIDPKADSSGSWSITIDGVTHSGTGQTIPSSVPLSERYVTRAVTCIDGANNWTDTAVQVEVEECIFESEI